LGGPDEPLTMKRQGEVSSSIAMESRVWMSWGLHGRLVLTHSLT
jgi:hypothetical protein